MEIGKNHVPIFTGDGPRSFEMLQKVMHNRWIALENEWKNP